MAGDKPGSGDPGKTFDLDALLKHGTVAEKIDPKGELAAAIRALEERGIIALTPQEWLKGFTFQDGFEEAGASPRDPSDQNPRISPDEGDLNKIPPFEAKLDLIELSTVPKLPKKMSIEPDLGGEKTIRPLLKKNLFNLDRPSTTPSSRPLSPNLDIELPTTASPSPLPQMGHKESPVDYLIRLGKAQLALQDALDDFLSSDEKTDNGKK